METDALDTGGALGRMGWQNRKTSREASKEDWQGRIGTKPRAAETNSDFKSTEPGRWAGTWLFRHRSL
jgi:hypothetical protein